MPTSSQCGETVQESRWLRHVPAARKLGISPSKLRKLVAAKQLFPRRLGRILLYDGIELERFAEALPVASPEDVYCPARAKKEREHV